MNKMSIKDKIFIIKKRIISKQNILLLFISLILILILEVCITSSVEILKAQKNLTHDSLNSRKLVLWEYNENKDNDIDKIDHILVNVSNKYYYQYYVDLEEFSHKDVNLETEIHPLLYDGEISFSKNVDKLNYGEIVCPKKFYPYSLYVGDPEEGFDTIIKKELIVDGEKLVGKTLSIKHEKSDLEADSMLEDIDAKVVGTYDNVSIGLPLNACFVSKDTFDKLKSNSPGGTGYIDEYGNEIYTPEYYNGRLLIIDDNKNRDYVLNELAKINLYPTNTSTPDPVMIALLVYIPLFVLCIVVIINSTVISNFVRKKIQYRIKKIALLKSFGYKTNDIIKIESYENIIIILLSFVLSWIIYIPAFIFIKNKYLVEFEFVNMPFNIPVLYIVSMILIIVLLTYIITTKRIKKVLKKDLIFNLKEETV